jgi:hypothetical protein
MSRCQHNVHHVDIHVMMMVITCASCGHTCDDDGNYMCIKWTYMCTHETHQGAHKRGGCEREEQCERYREHGGGLHKEIGTDDVAHVSDPGIYVYALTDQTTKHFSAPSCTLSQGLPH